MFGSSLPLREFGAGAGVAVVVVVVIVFGSPWSALTLLWAAIVVVAAMFVSPFFRLRELLWTAAAIALVAVF